MAQTMRSIASETRQADLVEFGALDEHEAGEEPGSAAVLAKTDITPEREMAGRQMLLEIEALFAEDAIGLAVLEAAARGDSAAEVQARLGLDSTTYASTLRRIRRRLTGYLLPTEP
jgi:DNA-directed RNA polymerase specialized sigma24 family protein